MSFYAPGKNWAGVVPAPVSGSRRPLDTDEYQYYYSHLLDDSVPMVVKSAIAVVLSADSKRIFETYYSNFTDETVENFVKYFKTLSGEALDIARSEIRAFEKMLTEPIESQPMIKNSIGSEPIIFDNWGEVDRFYGDKLYDVFKNHQTNLSIRKADYFKKIRSDIYKSDKEALKEQRDRRLKKEADAKNLEASILSSYPELEDEKQEYIRENIEDYFAATFATNPISHRLTELESELEYLARQKLRMFLSSRAMKPSEIVALYQAYIEIIDRVPSREHFRVLEAKLLSKMFQHPMARYS